MKSKSDELEEVKLIGPMHSQADPIIEVPHIGFMFGGPQLNVNDCDLVIRILHPIIQASTQAISVH